MPDTNPDQSQFQPDSKLIEWMRDIRRTIHQYPELANEENRTQKFICEKLQELGIPFRTEGLHTGIVATIGPSTSNDSDETPCVALRADMDALPVNEKTGLSFASKFPGVMHACGHDGHMAMLLGAASMLRHTELPGKVVLLFQPAEESGEGAEDGPAFHYAFLLPAARVPRPARTVTPPAISGATPRSPWSEMVTTPSQSG